MVKLIGQNIDKQPLWWYYLIVERDKRKTQNKGFASMDKDKAREAQSKDGKAAHSTGRAHKFTSESASLVGKRSAENRRQMILTVTCSTCEQRLTALELKYHNCC